MAILNFRNKASEDINYGRATKESFRLLPQILHRKAQIKLARLGAITNMNDLVDIRGNNFEALKGDRKGESSIRINDKYRVSFKWKQPDVFDVEIIDYP